MARNSSATSPGCAGRIDLRRPIEDRPAGVEPLAQPTRQATRLDHPPLVRRPLRRGRLAAGSSPRAAPARGTRPTAGRCPRGRIGGSRRSPDLRSRRVQVAEAVAEQGVDEADDAGHAAEVLGQVEPPRAGTRTASRGRSPARRRGTGRSNRARPMSRLSSLRLFHGSSIT